MEIGEDKVQGLDYAYTIQGWLKMVNTPYTDHTKDIGWGRRPNQQYQCELLARQGRDGLRPGLL